MKTHIKNFKQGLKNGIPISLGYLAVSLALGISASNAGMSAFQATVTSLLINASAGEYVGFTAIAANAAYLEIIFLEAVANARYLLMSCALSQKLPENTSTLKRIIAGFFITDEIFGASVSVPGKLDVWYTYGLAAAAVPGWAAGTCIGVIMGDILPTNIVSALSVGLYGMFIAIFIPPAKKNKVILGLVTASFILSFLFNSLPIFDMISSSVKIIILTVAISLAAALLFPVNEKEENK